MDTATTNGTLPETVPPGTDPHGSGSNGSASNGTRPRFVPDARIDRTAPRFRREGLTRPPAPALLNTVRREADDEEEDAATDPSDDLDDFDEPDDVGVKSDKVGWRGKHYWRLPDMVAAVTRDLGLQLDDRPSSLRRGLQLEDRGQVWNISRKFPNWTLLDPRRVARGGSRLKGLREK